MLNRKDGGGAVCDLAGTYSAASSGGFGCSAGWIGRRGYVASSKIGYPPASEPVYAN